MGKSKHTLKKENQKLSDQLNEKANQYKNLKQTHETMISKFEKEIIKYQKMAEQFEQFAQELEFVKKGNTKLSIDLDSKTGRYKNLENKVSKYKKEYQKMVEQFEESTQELEFVKKENKRLSLDLDSKTGLLYSVDLDSKTGTVENKELIDQLNEKTIQYKHLKQRKYFYQKMMAKQFKKLKFVKKENTRLSLDSDSKTSPLFSVDLDSKTGIENQALTDQLNEKTIQYKNLEKRVFKYKKEIIEYQKMAEQFQKFAQELEFIKKENKRLKNSLSLQLTGTENQELIDQLNEKTIQYKYLKKKVSEYKKEVITCQKMAEVFSQELEVVKRENTRLSLDLDLEHGIKNQELADQLIKKTIQNKNLEKMVSTYEKQNTNLAEQFEEFTHELELVKKENTRLSLDLDSKIGIESQELTDQLNEKTIHEKEIIKYFYQKMAKQFKKLEFVKKENTRLSLDLDLEHGIENQKLTDQLNEKTIQYKNLIKKVSKYDKEMAKQFEKFAQELVVVKKKNTNLEKKVSKYESKIIKNQKMAKQFEKFVKYGDKNQQGGKKNLKKIQNY